MYLPVARSVGRSILSNYVSICLSFICLPTRPTHLPTYPPANLQSYQAAPLLVSTNRPRYLPLVHTFIHACIHTWIHTYIRTYIRTKCNPCLHAVGSLHRALFLTTWAGKSRGKGRKRVPGPCILREVQQTGVSNIGPK